VTLSARAKINYQTLAADSDFQIGRIKYILLAPQIKKAKSYDIKIFGAA
jgi:hypothetical protein